MNRKKGKRLVQVLWDLSIIKQNINFSKFYDFECQINRKKIKFVCVERFYYRK